MINTPISIKGKINAKQELKGKMNITIVREYPDLENIEITPTAEEQIFKSTMYGYNEVKVKKGTDSSNATATPDDILEDKNAWVDNEEINGNMKNNGDVVITPTTEEQIKDKGYYNSLKVEAVTSEIDSNIIPSNIRAGVTVLNVEGILEEKIDTSDATATASDIALNKVAYVNDVRIVGNVPVVEGVETEAQNTFSNNVLTARKKETSDKLVRQNAITEISLTTQELQAIPGGNFSPENILIGKNVFGLEGNAQPDMSDIFKDTFDSSISYVTVNQSTPKIMAFFLGFPQLDWNHQGISLKNLYKGCSNVKNIETPINTENAQDATSMFDGCTNLVSIGNLDLSGVEYSYGYITDLFNGCNNLELVGTILLSDDFIQSGISLNNVFNGCYKLKSIPSNWNFAVKQFDSTFKECRELENVSSLSFRTDCNNLEETFRNCKKLKHIPTGISNIEYTGELNLSYLFYYCESLEDDLDLSKIKANNLNNTFQKCNAPKIILPDMSNCTNFQFAFGIINPNCIIEGEIDFSRASGTNLSHVFNSYSLSTLPTIKDNSLGTAYSLQGAFRNALITILPELNTSKITNMSQMCYDCHNLVDVPVLDTSVLTSFSSAFTNCYALSDTSLNNIMQMCINAVKYSSSATYRRLSYIGLSEEQAQKCMTLSNYSAFIEAGWTTGYEE